MPTQHPGRPELGQNFLIDQAVIDAFVHLIADTEGPIVEIGPGDGALTLPMQQLGRPVTGVEIDHRRARRLAHRTRPPTTIVQGDFLRYRLPDTPHVLVGNLPFHQTTVLLRRILNAPGWETAVLMVQWEVARRRVGVGGASMLTAQWWPWFAFQLHRRVPASAFRPRPGVDGGLLTVTRRHRPLVGHRERKAYQALVRRVFTGNGRSLPEILARAVPQLSRQQARHWMRRQGIAPTALPKQLTAEQWADLFQHFPQRGAPDRPTGRHQ